MLCLKRGDLDGALLIAREASSNWPHAGRLWALLARLLAKSHERQREAAQQQMPERFAEMSLPRRVLEAALVLVPRSGELWAEKGRWHSCAGQWHEAEMCWQKAIAFTPQYGDVFIEMIRGRMFRCLASRFGISATRNSVPASEIQAALDMHWNTTLEEELCVLTQPNHGIEFDEIHSSLGPRTYGSLLVLAKAKLNLSKAVLAEESNDQKTFASILFK